MNLQEYPRDEQGLLLFAIRQGTKVIMEYSGDILRDCVTLRHWARGYAKSHSDRSGVTGSGKVEWWPHYANVRAILEGDNERVYST